MLPPHRQHPLLRRRRRRARDIAGTHRICVAAAEKGGSGERREAREEVLKKMESRFEVEKMEEINGRGVSSKGG